MEHRCRVCGSSNISARWSESFLGNNFWYCSFTCSVAAARYFFLIFGLICTIIAILIFNYFEEYGDKSNSNLYFIFLFPFIIFLFAVVGFYGIRQKSHLKQVYLRHQ